MRPLVRKFDTGLIKTVIFASVTPIFADEDVIETPSSVIGAGRKAGKRVLPYVLAVRSLLHNGKCVTVTSVILLVE